MACVDEKPDMTCSYEKFHGRRYRVPVLPYMLHGRGSVTQPIKSDPNGKRCFDLNPGTDHATDCSKITQSPSGTARYSTDVPWCYMCAPFVGE